MKEKKLRKAYPYLRREKNRKCPLAAVATKAGEP